MQNQDNFQEADSRRSSVLTYDDSQSRRASIIEKQELVEKVESTSWGSIIKELFVVAPAICTPCRNEKNQLLKTISKMQNQLKDMQNQLKEKDTIIDSLNIECKTLTEKANIITEELEELTQSLFEEANKMVSEERKEAYILNKSLTRKLEVSLGSIGKPRTKTLNTSGSRRHSIATAGAIPRRSYMTNACIEEEESYSE